MEIFEILDGRLYQSGAPEADAEWASVLARGIDVVVDLYGSLDRGLPTAPNSMLYIFWPIEDAAALPSMGTLTVLVDTVVRLIELGHKVLVHCHVGKSRSGLFNGLVAMKILGINGKDAVELVRRRRPGALGNAVPEGIALRGPLGRARPHHELPSGIPEGLHHGDHGKTPHRPAAGPG